MGLQESDAGTSLLYAGTEGLQGFAAGTTLRFTGLGQTQTVTTVTPRTLNFTGLAQQVDLTATVSGSGNSQDESVSFYLNGGFQGTRSLLLGNPATVKVFLTGPGTYTISAQYSGTKWRLPSEGTGTVVIEPMPTTTITGPSNANLGETFSLWAAVTLANGSKPNAGSVEFRDGFTVLGTAAISWMPAGTAFFNTAGLGIGVHSLTATYVPPAGYPWASSISSPLLVTVTNNAPTFTAPANQSVEATSAAGAVATYTAMGDDVEEGPIAAVCEPASGATFALGTTTVSCTVTDRAGASASDSFSVAVVDRTPPSIAPTADLSLSATSASGAVGTYAAPATTDLGK